MSNISLDNIKVFKSFISINILKIFLSYFNTNFFDKELHS